MLGEVTGIPDRIASTKDTIISFAIKLGADGHIVPLESESLSLYAYLPMNEHRYKFPFYVNADLFQNQIEKECRVTILGVTSSSITLVNL